MCDRLISLSKVRKLQQKSLGSHIQLSFMIVWIQMLMQTYKWIIIFKAIKSYVDFDLNTSIDGTFSLPLEVRVCLSIKYLEYMCLQSRQVHMYRCTQRSALHFEYRCRRFRMGYHCCIYLGIRQNSWTLKMSSIRSKNIDITYRFRTVNVDKNK